MHIETLAVSAQNMLATGVFNKLTELGGLPKTWAKHDRCKILDTTVVGRTATIVAHMLRDLAKKSLGEESGSPFNPKIVDALPPKKFSMPKFNVYNGRTDPANHVRYYQQVMAYWIFDNVVMCKTFPTSLGDSALRWFTRLPAG